MSARNPAARVTILLTLLFGISSAPCRLQAQNVIRVPIITTVAGNGVSGLQRGQHRGMTSPIFWRRK